MKLIDKFERKYQHHINFGLSVNSIIRLSDSSRYNFDFDVWLPSKQMNLQRSLVWTWVQKEQLVISILKGLHIPNFVMVEHRTDENTSIYQIIDGKQRLTTMFSFIRNEFPITVEGQGYFFNDLDEECQNKIAGFYPKFDVHYSFYDEPISDETKIAIFEHVNFLGTPQDINHLNQLKSA